MTLAEIRDALWRATGTTQSTHPTSVIDIYINQSYWELQEKVDFREKETEASFSTVAGTSSYDISTNLTDADYLFHVTYLDPDFTQWQEVSPTDYQNIKDKLDTASYAQGTPSLYSRWGGDLYLYPVPDAVYSINVLYKKALGDVGISGPDIPESWHEFVQLGALYRFFRDLGEYNRAQVIRNERDSLVLAMSTNRAKEKVDYTKAGVSVLRSRYP